MNWHKFLHCDVRGKCNDSLSNKLNDCVALSYEEWCTYMSEATKEVAYEANDDNNGWFNLSADALIPLINIRNEALTKVRASEGEDAYLKTCARLQGKMQEMWLK